MPATFSQTTRALAGDRQSRALVALGAVLPLAIAWGLWFTRAEITVHEVTNAGRVEVAESAHDVDAPIAGRVVATRLALGMDVHAGEVLIELDAETEKRKLAEEKTRLATIEPELEARRRQLAAIDQSLVADREMTVTSLAQARARRDEAAVAARQAEEEARRAQKLHSSGTISEMELLRTKAEADRQHAALGATELELARIEGAQRTRDVQGRSRGEELRGEMAALEGQKERARAAIDVLAEQIEKRTIRARVAGHVGEVAKVGVGQFVKEGERLGMIVPNGGLRAIAEMAPEAALGRVRPGQAARMRMQGFPWTQYGTVPATVTNVASELRNGTVRVELRIETDGASRIPLSHGLPGDVEIDIERATPARLVLRGAGRVLAKPIRAHRE